MYLPNFVDSDFVNSQSSSGSNFGFVPDGYRYDAQDDSFIGPDGSRYGSNYAGTGLEFMSSDNPMYDAYFKANPYVNQTYHKTLIDRLFGGIFRTGYDKWRDEMSVNAAQYNAGIVDMQQQNQYNSEEAKAMRMRAAGENPDLLGTGDVSEAANTNPDPQDAQIPEVDDVAGAFGAITNFVGGFNDIIAGAFSMMKTFQDINFDKVKMNQSVNDLVLDDLFRTIPAAGFENDADFARWYGSESGIFDQDHPEFAERYFKEYNIPKSVQKRYRDVFLDTLSSLPLDLKQYSSSVERANLRNQLGMLTQSKFYSEGIDELNDLIGPLVELQDKQRKLEAEIAVLKAQNEKRLQGDIVPDVMDVQEKNLANQSIQADIQGDYLEGLQGAGYGNTLSVAEIARVKIGQLISEAQHKIITNLRNSSDNGSRLAKCLEYQMVLSQFYNFNPVNILSGAAGSVSDQMTSARQTAAMLAKMFM